MGTWKNVHSRYEIVHVIPYLTKYLIEYLISGNKVFVGTKVNKT